MPKKTISLTEYETLYEHLERSEAMIAVDAARVYGDVMAILYGEEWGKLKAFFDTPEWPERSIDIFHVLYPIWHVFFPDAMPSLNREEDGIAFAVVNQVIQKIARHILDAIYEIDGDHE